MIHTIRLRVVAWFVLVISLVEFLGQIVPSLHFSWPNWIVPLLAIVSLLYLLLENRF